MNDKPILQKDAIDDMATKFSDVIDPEGEVSDDEVEYIPLAAMPNDKLPEISIPLFFVENCVEIISLQSPSCFYIHLLKDKDIFRKFYEDLNKYYIKLGSDPISPALELPLGSHWCVHYNEIWLRAKVTRNMGKQYSEKHKLKIMHFEMLFVDYGFIDMVDLESINNLYEEFMHLPPFSISCCLAQVYPLSKWKLNPWSKETLNFFQAYFLDTNECKVTFLELNGSNTYEVVLELDGLIINEDLVKKGFAKSSIIASIIDENASSDSVIKYPETLKGDDDECLEDTWNPMKEDFFDERNTVHLDDTCAETVLLGIQNRDEYNLCKFFSKGLLCPRGETCKWTHIISRTDGLPSESEIVYSKLQYDLRLPPEGTILSAFVTNVFSPSNFYINICDLGRDGTSDVMAELQNDLSDAYGKSVCAHEISVPSIGELMVLYKAEEGLTSYYRVRVVNVIESDKFNLIKVFYIDYGIIEQVSQKFLRKLTNQFLRPPAQAVHCYLEDVLPVENDWQNSDPATDLFQNIIKDKIVTVLISTIDEHEEKVGLCIVDPDNAEKTVNEIIVAAGLGIMKI